MKTIIKINNIKIYGYHGLSNEEKKLGQKFETDVELHFDRKSDAKDEIESTIDYTSVCEEIVSEFLLKSHNLIEHLASQIINRLFKKFNLFYCKIKIRKPNAPVELVFDSIEVEIEKYVTR